MENWYQTVRIIDASYNAKIIFDGTHFYPMFGLKTEPFLRGLNPFLKGVLKWISMFIYTKVQEHDEAWSTLQITKRPLKRNKPRE